MKKSRPLKIDFQAGEMVQQIKGLAEKPDDLSSIPGTNTVEGEN